MVILDNKGMLTAGNNQYLQPDYLSPLPTTLDSKKSPLALLAQTCSQIGADSSKPLTPQDKKKDEDKKEKTPSPADVRKSPAFKPYESVPTKREENGDDKSSSIRPASSHGGQRPSSGSSNGGSSAKEDGGRRSIEATGATSSSASTTPIIRSGLEVLAGHPKDVPLGTYRAGVSPFLPAGYPGFETHPALRGAPPGLFAPGFLPGLSLASSYSGAAAALYSTAGLASSVSPSLLPSPYLTYTRVKTAGGGEAVVPVCRDPFCTGCPYSVQNNHLLQSGGACPPSCTQCEQAKAALSALPGLSSVSPSSLVPASSLLPSSPSLFPPVSSVSSASQLLGGPPRPYVCNWIAGDAYCGKRFTSSEELLQHLRSHTSVTSDTSPLSLLSSPLHAHAALLGSAHSSPLSSFHRQAAAYPPPSLSPLTAARYHPYGKPHNSLSSASMLTPTIPGLSHYPGLSVPGYPPGYPYTSLYHRPL